MKFFDDLYSHAWGRVLRRFVVVGISAVVPIVLSKLVLDPTKIVDSILALTQSDILFFVKVFIGAGVIAAIDKIRGELGLR